MWLISFQWIEGLYRLFKLLFRCLSKWLCIWFHHLILYVHRLWPNIHSSFPCLPHSRRTVSSTHCLCWSIKQTTGVPLLTVSVISVPTGTWFLRIHLTENPLCHVAFVIKEVGSFFFIQTLLFTVVRVNIEIVVWSCA